MKIYTKTGNGQRHGYFEPSLFFKTSENQKYESGSIFWYDQHDFSISGVLFSECLYDSAWRHLRKNSTSKILLFFGDEYYNLNDLKDWAKTILREKINPNQLYIVCIDKNWKSWTDAEFSKLGVNGVNVDSFNLLMERVEFQSPKPLTHRFSTFSRNYLPWRLDFFIKLFNKDVLKDFNYTFNNIMPYGETVTFSHNDITRDAKELGYPINEPLNKWIAAIPYTLEGDNVRHKLSAGLYDKMTQSGINVVIESHFDPFWNFKGDEHIGFKQFSPAFPTEKTYKAIACGRPFIIASTPEFLKEFRQLGYRTFHPYIDETYDTIVNNEDRMNAIVDEIERIAKLPTDEFNQLIIECEKIAQHNTLIMIEAKKHIVFANEFEWVNALVAKVRFVMI